MKKLILPQPDAAMFIAGIKNIIPDQWGNTVYNEKIFIYAEDSNKDWSLRLNIPSNQKLFNQMVLGNVSDELLATGCFIGYVNITNKGICTPYWESRPHLFVNRPHQFDSPIANYDTEYAILDKAVSSLFQIKRIARSGNKLIVPVGEATWEDLRDKECFKDIYLCWEDYMKTLVHAPSIISNANNFDETIDVIEFVYKTRKMIFETDGLPEWSLRIWQDSLDENYNTKRKPKCYPLPILSFDLACLSPTSSVHFKEKKPERKRKEGNVWVRMISTPMGGMNKWRR